jgi:hypothetical protein
MSEQKYESVSIGHVKQARILRSSLFKNVKKGIGKIKGEKLVYMWTESRDL